MKPGYKTTEFFALLVGLVFVALAGLSIVDSNVSFSINEELLKWWLLGSTGYAISRGLSKNKAVQG